MSEVGSPEGLTAEPARVALTAWWDAHHRDLPWRATRDPWEVLVAEVMLQQTQVERVVPRWHAFLERFATPSVCAAAPVSEVIDEWAGLGYNRRAVALHRAATACVKRHAGVLPLTLDELLALPGVGPYTARAVLAFAYEHDVGVVDTNVGRVLARTVGQSLRPAHAQRLADDAVPTGEGWAWNQAMLDLGATVCTKRAPRCDRCCVAPWCVWRGGAGDPCETDPAVGSAGVGSRQTAFVGSDRQGRGRLVDALRTGGSVPLAGLDAVTGWGDDERSLRVALGLVTDGLAELSEIGDALERAGASTLDS